MNVISDDVNKVARLLATKQLAKLNRALRTDRPVDNINDLPSDDDLFDIAFGEATEMEAKGK